MLSTVKSLSFAAVCLCFGLANHAVAGAITGAYFYNYTPPSLNDSGCGAPADGTRDYFTSITGHGSNSISGTDGVAFSICDGATGVLDGGEFTIGSGANIASGIFSGAYVGQSSDPSLIPGGGTLDNGALFDGTFTITSADGYYAGTVGDVGTMEVNTGTTGQPYQVNGYFAFTTAPEPVSMLLVGSGLVLIGLATKLRKS